MKHAILLLLFAALTVLPAAAGPAPGADDMIVDQPDNFVLSAAYPNPFNPQTTFSLGVEERQDVKVEVFNLLGRSVKVLFEGTMDADETRTFTFDAGDLPSGIYLYRVRGENFTATRQMTLLK